MLINQMLDSLLRSRSAFVVSDSPLQAREVAVKDLSFAVPLEKKNAGLDMTDEFKLITGAAL